MLCLCCCVQSEVASLQTSLAREQGTAQNATGRLAVLEASLAEQQVRSTGQVEVRAFLSLEYAVA